MKRIGIYALALLALPLAGCVSMQEVNALIHGTGDKTKSTFVDTVGQTTVKGKGFQVTTLDKDSQTTVLHTEGVFREGVTAENRNTFAYTWDGGAISLNGELLLDNTARAELLGRINDNQRAIVETIAPGAIAALEAGLPQFLDFLLARQTGGESNGPLLEFLVGILGGGLP